MKNTESIIPCRSERSICVAKNLYFIFEIFRFTQYDKKGQILRIAESRANFAESSLDSAPKCQILG